MIVDIELRYLIDKTERLVSDIDCDVKVSDSEILEVLEECLEQLYRLKDLEK